MRSFCCCLSVVLVLGSGPNCLAGHDSTHLVSRSELQEALSALSVERERNITEIRTLLAREQVRERVNAFADPVLDEQAITRLDDETLRDLGERSRQVNQEIAAAGTTTWVVVAAVAVAAIVITLVLVERFVTNE